MDEHTIPELHLSEELLQQITGGCKECNRDLLVGLDHQKCCSLHDSFADLAKSNGQVDQYNFHKEKATFHADTIEKILQKVDQREATPGHVVVPDTRLPPRRRWIM
jgi:hypothetical protein